MRHHFWYWYNNFPCVCGITWYSVCKTARNNSNLSLLTFLVQISVVGYCKSLKLCQFVNLPFIGLPIHSCCTSAYCADSFFKTTFVLCVRECVWTLEPFWQDSWELERKTCSSSTAKIFANVSVEHSPGNRSLLLFRLRSVLYFLQGTERQWFRAWCTLAQGECSMLTQNNLIKILKTGSLKL